MNKDYPLFKKWTETLNWILGMVEKYPKSVRFTLSDRIINLSFETLELIIEAIYTKNRSPILSQINIDLEKLRVFFRISWERKYLSLNQYEYVVRAINETGAMVGGWKKQSEKQL